MGGRVLAVTPELVVLDSSIFKAQGGGQPTDVGTLRGPGGEFQVTMCSLENGVQKHAGSFTRGSFEVGEEVSQAIDEGVRRQSARLHSAGHMLDIAVSNLDLNWQVVKGYHFPAGPYVEYKLSEQSKVPDMSKAAEKEALVAELQEQFDRLIGTGGKVVVRYPDGEPAQLTSLLERKVTIAGYEVGCGGTHVPEIEDIKGVQVKGIQKKGKGTMRVSYSVSS